MLCFKFKDDSGQQSQPLRTGAKHSIYMTFLDKCMLQALKYPHFILPVEPIWGDNNQLRNKTLG